MMQKLAPGVGAGGVVLLLLVVTSLLPIGAAGERFALAGMLSAAWLTMSGAVRSVTEVGELVSCASSASSQRQRFPRLSGTRAVTGARRAGPALRPHGR
ncbi:MAG TPA: hypothetical protein VK611_19555 [Acidimicrobiales bacterium]|nr:hypothetical protein [Acidimicrobiales bacterium]